MKKIIIYAFCFFQVFFLSGQSFIIKGSLFDYTTGNGLTEVDIDIYHKDKHLYSFQTNEQGAFEKSIAPNEYNIIITREDYITKQYDILVEEDMDLGLIFLEPKIELDLDEVVVIAKKKNISITNEGIKLSINDSPIFDGLAMSDALNMMPGVILNNGSIKVMGKSRILVLLNGRPTNINFNDLPLKSIDNIEIDPNASVKYNSQYDVVLNITLKKWVNEGLNGGVNATQVFNKGFSQSYNSYFNYNQDKFNLSSYLAIDKNESITSDEGYLIFNGINQSSDSRSEANRLSSYGYLNINYDLNEKDKVGVEVDYLDSSADGERIDNIFFINQNTTKEDSSFISNANNDWDGSSFSIGGFYLQERDNYKLDISLKYFSKEDVVNRLFDNKKTTSYNPIIEQTSFNLSKNNALIYLLDFSKELKKEIFFEAGLRVSNLSGNNTLHIDLNNSILENTDFNFNEQNYAIYSTGKKSFEKASLKIGSRIEYFKREVTINESVSSSSNQLNIFPSLLFDFFPSNDHYFKFSYGKKIERPRFNDLIPFEYFTSFNTRFTGNPDLRNQFSHNTDFLYYFKNKYYLNAYFNYDRDLIEKTGVIDNGGILNQSINYDYYVAGCQIGFTHNWTNWLSSTQKVSIEHVVSEGILLNNNFTTKSWEGYLYLAQSFNFKDKGNFAVISTYGTPNYYDIYRVEQGFQVDVKYSFRLFNDKLSVGIRARDILNTYHNRVFSSFINQSSFYDKNINVRSVIFNLSYNFNKGRRKDIKTGTNISGEKARLKTN